MLIDNKQIYEAFNDKQIIKYLKEEGYKKAVVRGNNIHDSQSLIDYYETLPGNFIISSLQGSPKKSELSQDQKRELVTRIKKVNGILTDISAPKETIKLTKDSLSKVLTERIAEIKYLDDGTRAHLANDLSNTVSRSDAYAIIDGMLSKNIAERLKLELVDPSYNSLFVKTAEAFVQDRIRVLDDIPKQFLQAGITVRALRKKIELAQFMFEIAIFIKSMGSEKVVEILTDKAIDYVEHKLQEKGLEMISRKNWFGLYTILAKKMGVEFK